MENKMSEILEIIENGKKCWRQYKMLKIVEIIENGEKNVGINQMLAGNVGLDINC